MDLIWKKELPTSVGYYWTCDLGRETKYCELRRIEWKEQGLAIVSGTWISYLKNDSYLERQFWAGPLLPPLFPDER